ncbi:putative Signal transduction protein (AoxS) [Thiomonas arsenitoxydans]|uniref:histidine kinase n=2 Tax=Thiomonas TaxID=32012 RepID=A0A238D770_THIDL|nr:MULTISPECIES: HAMP domain-containing sensor histidine kinase [Thiomonas]CQR42443.1 putative Signal transduction protein (AoxS) [Thiomonas sp. CB3]CAZ89764.1 putative Signal transduction protein (AoxS) [Thiomonas arsenitoxydans]CDW96283.1 putative Signal transduction protein (AoxS) [Thiomonas sp. CB2]CQR31579.1 putative Signal transduction protein (AoxS) [Thiomonas arsenitoxydans]CQR36339.1 putative Signal transduction protein (AoxS) [Thiomonas arsenitoxydans]
MNAASHDLAIALDTAQRPDAVPRQERATWKGALLLRLPLIAATLVALTALLMAAGLGLLTRQYLIEDVDAGAFQAMAAWNKSLPTLIQQDNVWAAYEALTSVAGDQVDSPPHSASIAVLIGPGGRVFASSDPTLFPTARPPVWTPLWAPGSLQVSSPLSVASTHPGLSPPIQSGNWRIYVSALRADSDAGVGTLVYAVSDALYRQRLRSMTRWITAITLLAVAVFVPIVWMLTRRMLAPLVRLQESMRRNGDDTRRISAELAARRDEVGALAAAFARLLEQAERAQRAEKLAAVGALAAATAHEINNPLGGMLNALHTAQRFGQYDDTTRQTLDLLDRGLEQLRNTAQALLAQTRPAERDLARQDFHDLVELIGPCQHERGIELQTRFDIPVRIPVAAGPVRQATLNILLNACHAAEPGSTLELEVDMLGDALRVQVRNRGTAPSAALLSDIAPTSFPEGSGFGLWESRRLLSDVGGTLKLAHTGGVTTATIDIPLRR